MYPETVAAKILTIVEVRRCTLKTAAKEFFSRNPSLNYLKPPVRVITLNVARNFMLLDECLRYVGYDVYSMRVFKRNLARVLAYQILSKGVNISKVRFQRLLSLCKMSEDVARKLRSIDVNDALKSYSGLKRLAIKYSIPIWLLKKFIEAEVPKLEEMLKAFLKDPVKWIKVYEDDVDLKTIIEALSEEGIEVEQDTDFPYLFKVVKSQGNLLKTSSYRKGYFRVIDKASIIVIEEIPNVKGRDVVDLTGAPGVKVTCLIDLGARRGVICDISERRLKEFYFTVNYERYLPKVCLVHCDSRIPPLDLKKFDVIIVDPECSNLGRLSINPEVKMILEEGDIERLRSLQRRILKTAILKSSRKAVILYSTCTLTLDENEKLIRELADEYGLELVKPRLCYGLESRKLKGTFRLYPHIHETQGFFYALLRKG